MLVASRKNDFKEALIDIDTLKTHFSDRKLTVKYIGMDELDRESAADYDAIALINTCLSWSLNRKVEAFAKHSDTPDKIVVLTTSGEGNWMPDESLNIDAIACASKKENLETVTLQLIQQIEEKLALQR